MSHSGSLRPVIDLLGKPADRGVVYMVTSDIVVRDHDQILIRCAAHHDCECALLGFLVRSEVWVGRCGDEGGGGGMLWGE